MPCYDIDHCAYINDTYGYALDRGSTDREGLIDETGMALYKARMGAGAPGATNERDWKRSQ
ncbi:hypothetical protein D0544_11240 [Aestuariirhabdus litorea]|uniref:Uncharacterized protein n=1 Tax=Aestuariirhabdus litorea TaxID=2528527 RepID=A0A3P3VNP5_9GAMM|nr:hypothetical protein D0544_11240 [Aestuariirhabdus litorea]